MVKFQTYTINNYLLTNQILESYINNFWNDVFNSIKDTKHLMLMCKVEFNEVLESYITHFWNEIFNPVQENKHLLLMCKVEFNEVGLGHRTLGHLRKVNFNDKELFIKYLTKRLGYLNDSYVAHPISKITFSYLIKQGLASGNRKLLQDYSNKSLTNHRFNNLNVPISMSPSDYGTIIATTQFETFIRYIVNNGSRNYKIDVALDELTNKVNILGSVDLSWVDTKLSGGVIKREIGKSFIYFMDGERVLTKKLLNAKPFQKVAVDSIINSNFITMDIETINLRLLSGGCIFNYNSQLTAIDLFNKINWVNNSFNTSKDIVVIIKTL
jgi:hypothetical protein